MSKRIGIAKVLGEAVYDLDQLAIDIPVSVQLTLYKAKSPDTPRGVIDVTIRLFNPSLVALAARMDVAKHKMLTQLKTKVGIIRHLQRNVRNRSQSPVPLDLVERDGSTVSSDIERSEFTDDEGSLQYPTCSFPLTLRLRLRKQCRERDVRLGRAGRVIPSSAVPVSE